MIENFSEHNLENMGGCSRFNFIINYHVDTIPDVDGNTISQPIVLKNGMVWFTGAALLKSLSLEEKVVESNAGDLYKYEFSGVYPGQNASIASLFDDLKSQPLMLDIEDNNNNRRLLGNKNNPCKFTFNFKTKESPSGRPEYTFSFTWESPQPAPFYNI